MHREEAEQSIALWQRTRRHESYWSRGMVRAPAKRAALRAVDGATQLRSQRSEYAQQKTDRLDAQHILTQMVKDDFPKIWVRETDVRQPLWHRHRMVQTRTRNMNQLQAAALNDGVRDKKKLWRDTRR